MAVTPTIQNVKPVVGASADVWGGVLNDRIGETYTDIQAIATQFNVTQPLAAGALSRAGGTMTGDQILSSVGPTSTLSSGYRGAPVVNFTGVRVLVLTDAGKTLRLTGNSPGTLQIPLVASVAFPVGTVIRVRNFSTLGTLAVQAPGAVDLRKNGSATDEDLVISTMGTGTLIHEATNVWVLESANTI